MKNLVDYISLNEALDYSPDNSDGAADWRADFLKETIQLLIDKCKECMDYANKHSDDSGLFSKAAWAWSVLGMSLPYLEMLINKEYSWYINDEILDILYSAIEECENDEEFHKGWKDKSVFEKSLKDQRTRIDKIKNAKTTLDKKYPNREI